MLSNVKRIRYEPIKVLVVDNSVDSQRRDIAEIAERLYLKIDIVRKADSSGFKAGALNSAISQLDEFIEYVLVLDIDHSPRPGILNNLVPVLNANKRIAFVQAPQIYISRASLTENAFTYKQRIFYDIVCPGLSASGCLFMTGTNVLIRVGALKEIGGFDESSLTEDVRTSLQLHARGWQSVYFPGPVADGFPPMDLRAYQKQLRRWAIGTFQNWKYAFFLLLSNRKSLSLTQWLVYLGWNGLFYMQSVLCFCLMIFSVGSILFGSTREVAVIDYVLLLFAFSVLLVASRHERSVAGSSWASILSSIALFYNEIYVVTSAFVDLIADRNIEFDVTPKKKHLKTRLPKTFYLFHYTIVLGSTVSLALEMNDIKFGVVGLFWPVVFFVQSCCMLLWARDKKLG